MSDRERVEAEAREWSQAELWICRDCERGFIAGRTVTAEQVEAAARDLAKADGQRVDVVPEFAEPYKPLIQKAFRAAGLLIEGEDDE